MPKWMRLKSTGDYPFHQRVLSSYENGFDEGPVAKFTAFVIAVIVIVLGMVVFIIPLLIWFAIRDGVKKLFGLRNADDKVDGSNPQD
ncbi:membrane protein [Streptomyces phage Bmoc]|uniref:Membrane protein n=1 Tax=Streptomyces phage Bmoc TaxID=2725629 RepID=A0A6M3T092_9CAUD|nr:membrane protein [Streptomyces phage Bmoc]QJD50900.1 membrane protein [Streptomyces phage Bmoc]